MTCNDEKITAQLETLLHVTEHYALTHEQQQLRELQKDVASNDYTIVVVGEFNHGKSTFVNALLGEALLPTGIVPTTATINALYYAEERQMHVCYKGEEEQPLVYAANTLQAYIAEQLEDVNAIDYVRIGAPLPLLQNNVLLIDTPGLNDVNELRTDITYSFIPRADVVFFMLQMHKPLNRTEVEFLKDGLLKQGIDRIVFIANFVDQVEEEEIEDALAVLKARLQMILQVEDVTVFAISAKEAVEAKQTNDDELLELSGILPVEQTMFDMCMSGTRQQEKNERLQKRLAMIKQQVLLQLADIFSFYEQDAATAAERLQAVRAWQAGEQGRKEALAKYIEQQETMIVMMLHKSIDYFFTTLTRRVEERIDLQTTNIENFFEKDMPLFIKYQLKGWIEMYTPQLQTLFMKLEQSLVKSLTEAYEETFHLQQTRTAFDYDDMIDVAMERSMDPQLKSGLVIAGASSVMLLTAPILVPFVAVFGMPLLAKKLQQKQVDEKKPILKVETLHQLQELRTNFTYKVEQYVRKTIAQVAEATFVMVDAQQQQVFNQIEQLHTDTRQNKEAVAQKIAHLETTIETLGGTVHV